MEEHEDAQYCYQDRNSSCRKKTMSTYIYVTLYIIFSLISAVTVFLNLLVIISISHFKQLHTPTNLLIVSLAVSDLLVGLIAIPAISVAIMEPCWVPGKYLCALVLYSIFVCESSSVGNLILISIDRYVAVCDPLLYHLKVTITRTKCCILITWGCCIMYDAALLKIFVNVQIPSKCYDECYLHDGDIWVSAIDIFFSMIVPCSVIITLYLRIFAVARSQARKVFSKGAVSVSGATTVQASKSEKKAATTLGIVVFNYLLFWNPFIYIGFIFSTDNFASIITCFLPLLSSFINPMIYAFFYPWFKMTAKRILSFK